MMRSAPFTLRGRWSRDAQASGQTIRHSGQRRGRDGRGVLRAGGPRRAGDALGARPAGEPGSAAARARHGGSGVGRSGNLSPDIPGVRLSHGGSGEAPESGQEYEVAGALARPTKTRGIEGLRAALIGRDEELTKLDEALARVQAGQGHMVALIGEAGVGKSRLVAELKGAIVTHSQQPHSSSIGDQARTRQSAIPQSLGWKAAAWRWPRAHRMGRSWTCCGAISARPP